MGLKFVQNEILVNCSLFIIFIQSFNYSKLDVVALNESLILASGIIRDAVTARLNIPTLIIAGRIQCILKFMLIFVIVELN